MIGFSTAYLPNHCAPHAHEIIVSGVRVLPPDPLPIARSSLAPAVGFDIAPPPPTTDRPPGRSDSASPTHAPRPRARHRAIHRASQPRLSELAVAPGRQRRELRNGARSRRG